VVVDSDKMEGKDVKGISERGEKIQKADAENNQSGFISARKKSNGTLEKPVQAKKKTAGTGSGSGGQEKFVAEPKLSIIDQSVSSSGSQAELVRGR